MSTCNAPQLRKACQDLQMERYESQQEWNTKMENRQDKFDDKVDCLTWTVAKIVGVGTALNIVIVIVAAWLGAHK